MLGRFISQRSAGSKSRPDSLNLDTACDRVGRRQRKDGEAHRVGNYYLFTWPKGQEGNRGPGAQGELKLYRRGPWLKMQ